MTSLHVVEPHRRQEPPGPGLHVLPIPSQRQGRDGQGGQHGVPHHQALRELRDPARSRRELPRGEARRIVTANPHLPRGHGQRSQKRGQQGGLARSAVAVEDHQFSLPQLRIDVVQHPPRLILPGVSQGERRPPVDRDSPGPGHDLPRFPGRVPSEVDGDGFRVGRPRDPEPQFEKAGALGFQDVPEGTVGENASRVDHHQPLHDPGPAGDVVIGDDQGGAGAGDHVVHRLPQPGGRGGVEHRPRFVEEKHVGFHGQRPRQRQSLGLPARQRRRRVSGAKGKINQFQRFGDPSADLRDRQAEVLRPEGDVTPHGLGDDRVEGLLSHQADVTATRGRRDSPDRHLARELPRGVILQHPGEGPQQGGFPRPADPGQQDPLPRPDLEIHIVQERVIDTQGLPCERDRPQLAPLSHAGPGVPGLRGRRSTPRSRPSP